MGNKIGRRRQVVDDKYTRPQGLYQLRDIDLKKLRKLILDAKLAPCYPGDDDGHTLDLEECPICFLYFPSLNRSRCCTKGICTECFLQMKPSYSTRLAQCPFCKTPNYAVEYRGAKTKEEKGVEQVEEQLVIEAQIRMQQQELQNAKGKLRKKEESSSSRRALSQAEVECQDVSGGSHSVACFRCSTQDDEAISSQRSCIMPISERPSHSRQIGEDNFNLELEDMMIMEAVWISIQEQGIERSLSASGSTLAEPQLFSEDCYNRDFTFPVEPSPSGGLACRTAALSESHHMSCGLSTMSNSALPVAGMLQSANFPPREDRVIGNYPAENWAEDLEENRRFPSEQDRWMAMDPGSIRVESGTCYTSSDITIDAGLGAQPLLEEVSMASGNVVPGNFEDQMMITVAASVVEAGARMNPHALTWL